jgi:hypothetical protein
MAKNTLNRNGKMLLANWFEIPDKDYIWYRLQGYTIAADKYRVVWLLDSKLHREDGPAVITANGGQAWWLNDKLHRTDGPAVIWANGGQARWLNGKEYTESEWKNAIGELV